MVSWKIWKICRKKLKVFLCRQNIFAVETMMKGVSSLHYTLYWNWMLSVFSLVGCLVWGEIYGHNVIFLLNFLWLLFMDTPANLNQRKFYGIIWRKFSRRKWARKSMNFPSLDSNDFPRISFLLLVSISRYNFLLLLFSNWSCQVKAED